MQPLYITPWSYRYDELDAMLPEHVKSDHYCSVLLANLKIIASVMRQVIK